MVGLVTQLVRARVARPFPTRLEHVMTSTTVTPAAEADTRVNAAIVAAIADPSDLGAYTALSDRVERRRVRDAIEARSRSTIAGADPTDPESAMAALVEAKRLSDIHAAMGTTKSRPKSVPDPVADIAAAIVTFRAAADLLASGVVGIGDGEPVDFGDTDPTDLLVRDITPDIMRLVSSLKSGTRSPNRYDTTDAFRAAFTSVGDTVTVSTVCAAWESAGGPSASDANGRVRARLLASGGCTVPFVEVVPATATSPLSVRFTADPSN